MDYAGLGLSGRRANGQVNGDSKWQPFADAVVVELPLDLVHLFLCQVSRRLLAAGQREKEREVSGRFADRVTYYCRWLETLPKHYYYYCYYYSNHR